MAIPQKRADALLHYTRTVKKKGLRSFLGSGSFYRRYVQLLANNTAVLSPATSKPAPAKVVWTEMESTFQNICQSVSLSCVLTIPLPEDHMSIVTDSSGSGIGVVLQFERVSGWKPPSTPGRLGSQSRGIPPQNWEALALVETVRHFDYYLYWKAFTAFTDHQPLFLF